MGDRLDTPLAVLVFVSFLVDARGLGPQGPGGATAGGKTVRRGRTDVGAFSILHGSTFSPTNSVFGAKNLNFSP